MNQPQLDEAAIFDTARQIQNSEERRQFIERSCSSDQRLLARVEALLRVYDCDRGFMSVPHREIQEVIPAVTRAAANDQVLQRRYDATLPADVGSGNILEPAAAQYSQVGETEGAPIGDKRMTEGPGTLIGPYLLLELIGEGGMGAVWLAEQSEPIQRQVALKVIKEGMDSKQVLARFEAERQALALMEHPNIAKVLDAGKTPSGRPYFVMEWVKGKPITNFCDEKRLPVRERLELFGDICRAVQHAHQKGIIHRDLKPSNVLVALYDGKSVVKVIDFGVAKAIGQQLTNQTLFTGFGTLVGTLEYMSPEQAEFNNQDIDTRSDIYSLGVMLYELLTGSTPLTHKRIQEAALLELLRIIREEEPPKPSTRLSTTEELPSIAANRGLEPKKLSGLVRGELDWIVMKALEKDRSGRYQTANGFAMDVQSYLADEPVLACPPSGTYRLRKFARKNRKILAVAAAFILVLTAATVVSLGQAFRATKAEHTSDEQRIRAENATKRAHRDLYDAHMRLAQSAWEDGRVKRVLELLDHYRQPPEDEDLRGFEWHYWQRLTDTALQTFAGHERPVWCVAFRPDGEQLASASDDGTVKIWNVADGRPICTLQGNIGGIRSVAYSPDGKLLAAAGSAPAVEIWDTASGLLAQRITRFSNAVTCVAFSLRQPDGTFLLSSANEDGKVQIWDPISGRLIRTLKGHDRRVESVAFSPDGNSLASGGADNLVKIWDLATGHLTRFSKGHADLVTSLAYSPNGKLLASASADRTIRIWNIAASGVLDLLNLQSPPPLRGHTDRVFGVAFSPDGKRVASASVDQTIRIWDSATGQEALVLKGHTSYLTSVAFSPDGKRLASASNDRTVKLWDVSSSGESTMVIQDSTLKAVAFSPDGRWLASAGTDKTIKLWDSTGGRPILVLNGHRDEVGSIAISRDGKQLVSGSVDKTVRIWDTTSGKEIALPLTDSTMAVLSVAISPDGKWVAAGGLDKIVRIWELASGRLTFALSGHTKLVSSVAFSRDGEHLASAGQDGTIRLWNPTTGRFLMPLSAHAGAIHAVAFSPNGSQLASAGEDMIIRIWDSASGQIVQQLEGHVADVNCLAYSPDGKRLASGAASVDKTVKVWDTTTGQEVLTLKGHTLGIPSVAFSSDGWKLASASFDGTVRVWDARPWTHQLRIEQEARNLINARIEQGDRNLINLLYTPAGRKMAVIRQIERDTTLSPEVRQEALAMTKRWRE